MATTPQPKYEIELWDGNDVAMADISKRARNRRWSQQRNESERLEFDLDISSFEKLAASINVTPREILEPNVTDVKIKRRGDYLFGTEVKDMMMDFQKNGSSVNVRCLGYLSLLADRYVSKQYGLPDGAGSEESTDIARDLITTTQAQTNGDFGITMGANQYDTGVPRYRLYTRQNVKEGIVNLTDLTDGHFDVSFNHLRQFETWQMLGNDRPDVVLSYPHNIRAVQVPRTAMRQFNRIIGIGSGFGAEAITSTQDDLTSQITYGLRELPLSFNSISVQETLDEHTAGELGLRKDILELPRVVVSGKIFDQFGIGIGDRIVLRIEKHPLVENIYGQYRIEKIEVDIDKNDDEVVSLTFDNYGL